MALPIHMQEVKVKGHTVQKLEKKWTDEQTDGGDCATFRANAVGNKSTTNRTNGV